MEIRPIDANALALGVKRWFVIPDNRKTMKEAIDNAPTIDYAPVRHGEWVEQEGFDGDTYHTCSACNEDWVCIDGSPAENNMHFCPNCGAKMDGGKNNG